MPTRLALIPLLIGLLLRLYLIASPDHMLITIVPDDGFYYLVTAQHIVSGDGSTFDGIHPTNGYHPLWMAVLVPMTAIWHSTDLLRPVLILSTGIVTAACLGFAALVNSRTRNPVLSALAFAVVYLHPLSIAASLNALETSTVMACFVAVLWAFHAKRDLLLGVSLSLLMLARTDQIFIAIPIALAYLRIHQLTLVRAYMVWMPPMWTGSLYALYNLATFGSVVQVSGSAVPYRIGVLMAMSDNPLQARLSTYSTLVRFVLTQQGLTLIGACIGVVALLWALWTWRRELSQYADIIAALIGFALLTAVHIGLRLSVRDWYFNHAVLLWGLILALALNTLWTRYRPVILVMCAGWFVYSIIGINLVMAYRWQTEMLDSARWIRENTSADTVVGAWNAGIIGFYSDRPVVNLDGVMNNAAFETIQKQQLTQFIHDSGITIMADYRDSFTLYEWFMGAPLQFEVLHEIDSPDVQWRDLGIVIGRITK